MRLYEFITINNYEMPMIGWTYRFNGEEYQIIALDYEKEIVYYKNDNITPLTLIAAKQIDLRTFLKNAHE